MAEPQGSQDRPSETLSHSESPSQNEDASAQSDAPSSGEAVELGPAELVARHQRGIWRYLRMLGCDSSTADDLTQETFLRVLRRDSFVQHSDAATSSYLRRTAYNLLVSQHRKQGRVQTIAEPALLDETWDRWAGKDLTGDLAIEALRECFSTLSERAQQALKLRFADQVSRVDIGKSLDISDHGARNLMQRAKQQLRQCVEQRLRGDSES